jgi:NAD(P)-dependent dehydrogenase (short-subunit alcohol dehydrogenase family)
MLIEFVNRGLGAVVAEKFAAEGCNLAINYLFSQEQADNLATDLAKKHGINAVTIQAVRIGPRSD